MEVGKHVVVKKGEHTDERGIIMSQVGVGCARKWLVRFDNDAEIAFHAKSLEIEEEYDASGDEMAGNDEEKEGERDGNAHIPQVRAREDNIAGPDDEEGFDDGWRALVNELV